MTSASLLAIHNKGFGKRHSDTYRILSLNHTDQQLDPSDVYVDRYALGIHLKCRSTALLQHLSIFVQIGAEKKITLLKMTNVSFGDSELSNYKIINVCVK